MKPQPTSNRFIRYVILLLLLASGRAEFSLAQSQLPECTSDVPFFVMDLSSDPDSTYTTPEIIRKTGCCGVNDEYVSFYVTLHPDVAMFELIVAPGYADPGGSGNYTIISGGDLSNPGFCGTPIQGGSPICITGAGPHKIVYSKPGKNKIKYIFRQIPKPIFPSDQPTRLGCSLPLPIYGLNNIHIEAIDKSTNLTASLSQCDAMMSCLTCADPTFQAAANVSYPYTVTYSVSGSPIAEYCGTYPSSDTFTITVYGPLDITYSPQPARFCEGGTGVNITASGSGGWGTYAYLWLNSIGDTIATTSSYIADSAQNYTVILADDLVSPTCPSKILTVPVIMDSPPSVNAGVDTILCATEPVLFLSGTSSTGSGLWSGGSGTFTPSATSLVTTYNPTPYEIANGVDLILTSSGTGIGCSETTDTLHVTYSDSISITLNANSIACYNGQTTVTANVSGGTAPLIYQWSTGASGSSIVSGAGTVELFISDAIGCAAHLPISLIQPEPLYTSVQTTLDAGTCNGTAVASVTGGTSPFNFLWSSGSTGPTDSNLCAGIDSVLVTDANGCTYLQSFVINTPTCALFDANIVSVTPNPCYGDSLGSITAGTSGATGYVTYSWNTNPVSYGPTATGLLSGAYSVLAIDSIGCMDIANAVVVQPTLLTNTITHTNVSVIAGNDGTATANAQGGTPGYTYLWTPSGQTSQQAVNLSGINGGQIYQVTVTDQNDCAVSDSVLINEPPCNDFIIGVSTQNVSCYGGANGSASLVIADGTPPYSITWSTGHTSIAAIDNLSAGNYVVTVTDASFCTTFQQFTITQPAQMDLVISPTQVSCHNYANGSIDLTVFGGTYPYTYQWLNGGSYFANHEDLFLLDQGDYFVTVTDQRGCTDTLSSSISEPTSIEANYTYSDNPCNGNSLGNIQLSISGGTQPYTFSWVGPSSFTANTSAIEQLVSGLYTATITDINNCELGPIEVYINEPDSLLISTSISEEVTCLGLSNGMLSSSVSGGTLPYQYTWSSGTTVISNQPGADSLAAGIYTLLVMDSLGCSATDSIQLTTIVDTIAPSISCAGNQTVSSISTACYYAIQSNAWDANASDNCTVSSLTYSLSGATSGTGTTLQNVQFQQGITTVIWTATDSLGNSTACSYTVTVLDNTPPALLSCAVSGNQVVSTSPSLCYYVNQGTLWNPTATDNCSTVSMNYTLNGATSGTGSTLNGVSFMPGTTQVQWTISDTSGNVSYCNYSITINDTEAPSISCAGNQTVSSISTACYYAIQSNAWDANASDNCTVSSLTYSLSGATSGTGTTLQNVQFQQGITTVIWTATDSLGNSTACSYTVTVLDNTPPAVLSCAITGNQVVSTSPSLCYYVNQGTLLNPTATDNCSTVSMIYTLSGATSGSGNTLNGVSFMPGTTQVQWTISDTSGNVSYCNYSITVNDTEAPSISCGGNQTVSSISTACYYAIQSNAWDANASDNCTVSSLTYSLSGATSGTGTTLQNVQFQQGITTVIWTATDSLGNSTACSYTVTVLDNTPPAVLSCAISGNQVVSTSPSLCYYVNQGTLWNPTATDNCSTVSMNYTLSGATSGTGSTLNGVSFMLGTTQVQWTISDTSGNVSYCNYSITVNDTEAPSISCAGNQTVSSISTACYYAIQSNAWDANASDNCTVSSLTYSLSGATSGTGTTLQNVQFQQGITTVIWTATDSLGNSTACSYTVTVLDNTPPAVLSCAISGNQVVSTSPSLCYYVNQGTLWNPTATDNCSTVSMNYTLSGATSGTGSTLNGISFMPGTTQVQWTISDTSGNVSYCNYSITVNDTEAPSISCAGNQSVSSISTACYYAIQSNAWDANASDNCTVSSLTYSLSGATSGTGTTLQNVQFQQGITTVIWTATDSLGNSTACSYTVTVLDNTPPAVLSCAISGNQVVSTSPSLCYYVNQGTLWNPTATDNCSTVSMNYTLSGATSGTGSTLNGVSFMPGTTQVQWTISDTSGNVSYCNYSITVNDTEAPSILGCPGNINAISDPSICGTWVIWNAPFATDNCSVTMNESLASGTYLPVGQHTITYIATDNSLNSTTCSFTVQVIDQTNPVSVCPPAIHTCQPLVNFDLPTSMDNCAVQSTIQTLGLPSGSTFPIGSTDNTFLITDIHGNQSTCSFSVHVYTNPLITLNATDISCNGSQDGAIDASVTGGNQPYQFLWSNNQTSEDLSALLPGNYTLSLVDNYGCISSQSVSINEPNLLVVLGEPSAVSCYAGTDGSIDISVTGGTEPYLYSWSNSTSQEDLSNVSAGFYQVDVIDANGCPSTLMATVESPAVLTVTSTPYSASCLASNGSIRLAVDGGTGPYTYSWSTGSSQMNLTGASSGIYTVTITDANGCVLQNTGIIQSINNLDASLKVKPIQCYNTDSGEMAVNVHSGQAPYSFDWSNGAAMSSITDLGPGSYSVVITDSYGCTDTLTETLIAPENFVLQLTPSVYPAGTNISTYGNNDGFIISDIDGGNEPFTYLWSTGSTQTDQFNLSAGTYWLEVTDQFGCKSEKSIVLTQPNMLEMPSGISPNNDNDNDFFVIRGIEAYPDNDISIFNRWGNVVFQQNDYTNEWKGENNSGERLPDGTYFVLFRAYGEVTITLKGYVDLRR